MYDVDGNGVIDQVIALYIFSFFAFVIFQLACRDQTTGLSRQNYDCNLNYCQRQTLTAKSNSAVIVLYMKKIKCQTVHKSPVSKFIIKSDFCKATGCQKRPSKGSPD